MQKYNYDLDLNSGNSNSLILQHIKAGAEILEFGPAFGRLTKYLQSEMDCAVDIVEMDEESGQIAALYARKACIGLEKGNIENYFWESLFSENKYDYIVFADVLEHLHCPQLVLKKCQKFLKPFGKILCAIPNIAHSSVIISLWNNDFTYKEVGLLDNTHIHFFTRKSFTEMAEQSGYHISSIENVTSAVGTNEIHWDYSAIPENVGNELRFRPEGDSYEYIFCLENSNNSDLETYYNYSDSKNLACTCYVRERDDTDFAEEKCIKKFLAKKENDIYFDLNKFENIIGLRVQFVPMPRAVIRLNSCEINGVTPSYALDGIQLGNNMIIFENNSDIYINVKEGQPLVLHLNFEILSFGENTYIHEYFSKVKTLENEIQEKEEIFNQRMSEKEKHIEMLNNELILKETLLQEQKQSMLDKDNKLQQKEEEISTIKKEVQMHLSNINMLKNQIEKIKRSWIGKFIKK